MEGNMLSVSSDQGKVSLYKNKVSLIDPIQHSPFLAEGRQSHTILGQVGRTFQEINMSVNSEEKKCIYFLAQKFFVQETKKGRQEGWWKGEKMRRKGSEEEEGGRWAGDTGENDGEKSNSTTIISNRHQFFPSNNLNGLLV